MSSDVRREDFEYWLADMDDAVEGFLDVVPPEVRRKLDFSPASLDELEAWILQRYASTNAMLEQSESRVVDGLARYIGEAFRKSVGGRWEIRLDDPKYVFYAKPQLAGFWTNSTPTCPLALATTAADRRTGRLLSGVLASYLRDKQRREGRA